MQQFYWVSQKVHSGFSIASYRKKAEWHFWPTQNFQVFVWRKEKHESEKVYAPLCSLQHYYNSQNMEMIDMSKMDKDATHTHTHTHTHTRTQQKSESEVAQLCPTLCNPVDCAYQAPPSMGFSRQEYCSGVLLPSPGDLPNPGIEPWSPALQADALTSEPPGNRRVGSHKWRKSCHLWQHGWSLKAFC